jgi:hypothetical protein
VGKRATDGGHRDRGSLTDKHADALKIIRGPPNEYPIVIMTGPTIAPWYKLAVR